MKAPLLLVALLLLAQSARGTVYVYVEDTNGWANINYQCTAGEVIRALALDVTVNQGGITAITNFFRGPSTATARGYGIFPAALRDHVTVSSGTNANWNAVGYSPLAVVADNPGGTLPGLNSYGVTLEFGAVWDPTVPAAIPISQGTLCTLQLSGPAFVSITTNQSRGGIVAAPPEIPLAPQFAGAQVGPVVTSVTVENGVVTVLFQGGELETADDLNGPWTGTGNWSGTYTEPAGTGPRRFYRVRQP